MTGATELDEANQSDQPGIVRVDRPVRPCPFCGCVGVTVYEGSTFRWRYAACDSCGAQAPEIRAQTLGAGTPDEWESAAQARAIDEWNTRDTPKCPCSKLLQKLQQLK
jgi:Lar family restriction alleviation protein